MTGKQATLDTLIRSSAVDLFHSIGIALAPVERTATQPHQIRFHELTASIGFTARGFSGVLTLGVPDEVLKLLRQNSARPHNARDWVREMTNQLCGRLKGRLLQFQLVLQIGLPTMTTAVAFERQKNRGKFFCPYLFRTLRGDLVVTIAGDIDEAIPPFQGVTKVGVEGDIILFD